MKKLPKRDGIRRPRIYRGPSTEDVMRSALVQGIASVLANIGETEDCVLRIVNRGPHRKPRIAIVPKRASQSVRPLLAPRRKG
jgi:hypothetical protein